MRQTLTPGEARPGLKGLWTILSLCLGDQATHPPAPGKASSLISGASASRTYLGSPFLVQLHRHQSRRALLTHSRLPALPEEVDTLLFASHPDRVLALLPTSHCGHTREQSAG